MTWFIAASSLTSQVSIAMPSLVAVVVGVGACFNLSFDEGELVEAVAKTFVDKSKQQLDPSEVAFFPAKRGDEWLSAQEVDALKRGKVPVGLKTVMSSRNRMDPKAPVSSPAFGLQDVYSTAKVHVLVGVPEDVKGALRRSFAGQISFNKLTYYNGLLWPLNLLSWLCGVAAFMLGVYLYLFNENLVRGVLAACNPASGKLLSVGIPGVGMWILAAAAYVLAAAKAHFQRKSRDHQQRLDCLKNGGMATCV